MSELLHMLYLKLHIKKRFDDFLKVIYLFYLADVAQVIIWAFLLIVVV